jgi:hypothetical protein
VWETKVHRRSDPLQEVLRKRKVLEQVNQGFTASMTAYDAKLPSCGVQLKRLLLPSIGVMLLC